MKKIFLVTFLALGIIAAASVLLSWSSRRVCTTGHKQTGISEYQQKKDTAVKVVYTCSMHSEIKQDKAGKCPKCGMNLTAMETGRDVYTCPMHSEVVQNKPGKCPKCGMVLEKTDPSKK